MKLFFEDLIGKTLLLGMTYYTHDNQYIEQKQFWGTVVSANDTCIEFRQNNGVVCSIPPQLAAIEPAPPGEYTLNSTGEIVVNPDYLTTWSYYKPKEPK